MGRHFSGRVSLFIVAKKSNSTILDGRQLSLWDYFLLARHPSKKA
jgi:hypothetical protein